MTILEHVDTAGVHPALWLFLGAIAWRHRALTTEGMVVTSLRRVPGPPASLHSPGHFEEVLATDIRRHSLDARGAAEVFCRTLQADYGSHLGVVLEPEWLTPDQLVERGGLDNVAPHIHVELKLTGWPSVL